MTRYYPVVATIHYQDKFVNAIFELRVRIVELKRFECETPNCWGRVTPRDIFRAMPRNGVLTEGPLKCPNCKQVLKLSPEFTYKLYTFCDNVINGDLLLSRGLVEFEDTTPNIQAYLKKNTLHLAKQKNSRYRNGGRTEFYKMFANYDRLVDFLKTAKPVTKEKVKTTKGKRNIDKVRRQKVQYQCLLIPPEQDLKAEFEKYRKRQLIDRM